MKKLLLGTAFLALVCLFSAPVSAGVSVSVGIGLPPPVTFAGPPNVVVLPDAGDVYVAPEVDVDLFFWNGYWWRPWEGRWYRSRYYDRGWGFYSGVPTFYFNVDPGWRGYYRERAWYGHRWDYRPIPYGDLHRNWRTWHRDRYWEKHNRWGVHDYKGRPAHERERLRRERQAEYHKRPDVVRHQQEMRDRRHPARMDRTRDKQSRQPHAQGAGGPDHGKRQHMQQQRPPRQDHGREGRAQQGRQQGHQRGHEQGRQQGRQHKQGEQREQQHRQP